MEKALKFGTFLVISIIFFSLGDARASLTIEQAVRGTDMPSGESIIGDVPSASLRQGPEIPSAQSSFEESEKKVFIKKVRLDGAISIDPGSFSLLLARYENADRSFSELRECAREVEREYLARGVIAAVFVPPQDISEGTVVLQVVEARMGELRVTEAKYFKSDRLRGYWKLASGDVMNYSEISRSMQLMNRNPDRSVKASLRAGSVPGTTDVSLVPVTSFPLHFGGSFDREGGTATGRNRFGLSARHNNFLGLDDSFFVGYNWGAHFNGKYMYHLLPLNREGMSLLSGYSRSDAWPKKEFAPYGIRSSGQNYSVSLRQDLFMGKEYWGEAHADFEAKDRTVTLRGEPDSRDRLRILRGGVKAYRNGFGGVSVFSGGLAQGLPGILGASDSKDPMLSRGAHSDFTTMTLGARHRVFLPWEMQAVFNAEAQGSSTKLPTSETMSLGGLDSVRGYPAGDYSADNAVLLNSELLLPAVVIPTAVRLPYARQSLRETTQGVLFIDYGHGERRQAGSTEKKSADMTGVGAGVRVGLYDQGLLRLEWGFPVGDKSITESGHSRFHISFEFQERLPEELARIRERIDENNIDGWAWVLLDNLLTLPESRLRGELIAQLYEARRLRSEGRFEEERQAYSSLMILSRSLYLQAKEYVSGFFRLRKQLEETSARADQCFKEGKYAQARALWEQVISQAKTTPVVFSY